MNWKRLFIISCFLFLVNASLIAQRNYAPNSVLANGNWYKIGVLKEGVYKVDINLLTSLGISTGNLTSASIRLYGNGGEMLPENNSQPRIDDLYENAIEMNDGGDGIFNGTDFFLFYSYGTQKWIKDSANLAFTYQKNLFSDTAYYFISIGGVGKRVSLSTQILSQTNVTVTSFNERYHYENDLINHLNSGKEWYGEEFNSNFGGSLTRTFTVDWPGLITSQPVKLVTDLAARSIGTNSSFLGKINNQSAISVNLLAVSGNFFDRYATSVTQANLVPVTQSTLAVSFNFVPGVTGAQGWLNWFELFGRKSLAFNTATQLLFRDWNSVSASAVANFSIVNNANSFSVWEITKPGEPVKMNLVSNGSLTSFKNDASRLREYIAFSATLTPIGIGKITNQNLHNSGTTDVIIISHTTLLSEAQRLAQFHLLKDGYKSVVVNIDQIYHEFSGGIQDPTAIRDFVKMYFDKAGTTINDRPKYLILFGAGSYDYRYRIKENNNLVPAYESINSLDPLATYTSDDFFGLLEDGDDINANIPSITIDIGIGRIPAKNIMEAKTMVDKILQYHAKESLGAWRNQNVFVADDQDQNLHINDAEAITANASAVNPVFNQYKIYLDAYPLVSGNGGGRYPSVNDAIVSQVFNGTLIFNYNGHGSYLRLAEEAILTQEELGRFNNPNKLPLFITASCDFAPHDNPSINSLGSSILTATANGAIALLTTTRLVFAYSNKVMNDNYLQIALKPESDGRYLTLGESVRRAKNFTSLNSGDLLNNRKFTLLGDPAMRLSFPELQLQLVTLNGNPLISSDTLKALQKYTFTGRVMDGLGNWVNNFSGKLQTIVFDKPQSIKTLGNDPSSIVTNFNQQQGILYKGNATVTNGSFSFSFIVPKDINYQIGKGKISMYAEDGVRDASGVNNGFFIGGAATGVLTDNTGPTIKPYLYDDKFLNGGLTNENPVLLAKLYDSSGISTSGNGIGHDITAVIDGNERKLLILNDFYTANQDSYQEGQVLYQLPTLAEGKHSIRIKAWDVANNSGEAVLDFVVAKQVKLQITNLHNFPNPFNVATTFAFEHNQPNTDLDVKINIYNIAGGLVKEIKRVVNTGGTRNCQIIWNGDNQSGAKLAKGIYIYKVMVVVGGSQSEITQQLIRF